MLSFLTVQLHHCIYMYFMIYENTGIFYGFTGEPTIEQKAQMFAEALNLGLQMPPTTPLKPNIIEEQVHFSLTASAGASVPVLLNDSFVIGKRQIQECPKMGATYEICRHTNSMCRQ